MIIFLATVKSLYVVTLLCCNIYINHLLNIAVFPKKLNLTKLSISLLTNDSWPNSLPINPWVWAKILDYRKWTLNWKLTSTSKYFALTILFYFYNNLQIGNFILISLRNQFLKVLIRDDDLYIFKIVKVLNLQTKKIIITKITSIILFW